MYMSVYLFLMLLLLTNLLIAMMGNTFAEVQEQAVREWRVANAQALADQLMKGGLDIVTGGTDTHVRLVDLRPKGVKGNAPEPGVGRAAVSNITHASPPTSYSHPVRIPKTPFSGVVQP